MSALQRHPATENQSFSTIYTAEEPRATSSLPRRSLPMTRNALGRGLSALIREPEPPQQVSPPATPPSVTAGEPQQIDIDLIDPSPYQPRTRFREEPLQDLIEDGRLTAGHGRALLAIPDAGLRQSLAQRAARGGLTVRQIERLGARKSARSAPLHPPTLDANTRAALEELQRHLGTRSTLRPR